MGMAMRTPKDSLQTRAQPRRNRGPSARPKPGQDNDQFRAADPDSSSGRSPSHTTTQALAKAEANCCLEPKDSPRLKARHMHRPRSPRVLVKSYHRAKSKPTKKRMASPRSNHSSGR